MGVIEAQGDREAKRKITRTRGSGHPADMPNTKVSKKQNLEAIIFLAFTVQLSQLINAGVPLYLKA